MVILRCRHRAYFSTCVGSPKDDTDKLGLLKDLRIDGKRKHLKWFLIY